MLFTLLSASLVDYRGTLGKKWSAMLRYSQLLKIKTKVRHGLLKVNACSSFFLSFRKSHGGAFPGIHKLHKLFV